MHTMRRYRQYRIFRQGEEIAIVEGKSARNAIRSFVSEQVRQKFPADGWSAREFLKYSLRAQPVTPREAPRGEKFSSRHIRFSLRQIALFTFWSCVVVATLTKEFYALFGLIFFSPILFRRFWPGDTLTHNSACSSPVPRPDEQRPDEQTRYSSW